MKSLFAGVVALLLVVTVQAQGTFSFNNRVVSAGLDQPVGEQWSGRGLESPMVAAVLLNGIQLGPAAPFRSGVGAGYWNPGAELIREVMGKFSGDVVNGFTVEVWDSSKGQTYEISRAAGGRHGVSKSFSITLGGPKADPRLPADIPALMTNFEGFYIVIPEPSIMALGTLGVGVFLCSRKRG